MLSAYINEETSTEEVQATLDKLQVSGVSRIDFTGIKTLTLTDGLTLRNFHNIIFDFSFCILKVSNNIDITTNIFGCVLLCHDCSNVKIINLLRQAKSGEGGSHVDGQTW